MTRRARFVVITAVLLLAPAILSACPVCYGAPNSPMTKSSNNAIIFMLGIIGFVQVGFVAMFWSFWRRAKELRRRRESFRLVDGGAAH
jgi:heme/copper-type cytochrome/quinol oxidase subunit 2